MQGSLIILAKNPELGKVKTRLAATMGDEKALEIYLKLLARTREVTEELPVKKWIFYSSIIDQELFPKPFIPALQIGQDLGARMQHAFQEVFDQEEGPVCIIGSDCYELETEHVLSAFRALESRDVVIGSTEDGGYYLLGMKKLVPELFEGIAWSTETVFSATLQKAEGLGLSVFRLPELRDIDREEDWVSTDK